MCTIFLIHMIITPTHKNLSRNPMDQKKDAKNFSLRVIKLTITFIRSHHSLRGDAEE
mgnify:CR=1 FL=1